MLDVLLGFLALYFVDVAGAVVAVWTGVGLPGDLLLILPAAGAGARSELPMPEHHPRDRQYPGDQRWRDH